MAISTSVKNAVFYTVGEVVPRVMTFLLLPLYTRFLSTSEFGIISYTNTVVLLLFTIGSLSLNSYALRFFFIKKGDEKREMLGTITIAIALFNLLLLGLSYLILPGLIDRYNIQVPWKPFFQLSLVSNFLDSFSIIPFVIYRVQGAAEKFVTLGISKSICIAALTIYTVCIMQGGLPAYYWSQLIVYIPFTVIYLLILRRYVSFSFQFSILREGLIFALPLIPSSIAYILLNTSDRIILERYVDMGDLGIYNMAVTLSLALNVLVQGGYRAFEPVLYSHYDQKDYVEIAQKVKRMFSTIIIIGGLFVSLFAKEIFTIMTSSQFHEGYIYVPILVAMVCVQAINCLYSVFLTGDRKTGIQATSTIIGCIVCVCLNLLLIPVFGVFMAACTQFISMYVMTLIKEKNIVIPGVGMWKDILVLFFITMLVYSLNYIIQNITLWFIVVKLGICGVTTVLIMRLNNVDLTTLYNLVGIRNQIK